MNIFIGIDDTDNLETRGTGFRARELGSLIQTSGLGNLQGVVRHQLLVHPNIPYTSHNSSASLVIDADDLPAVWDFCKNYLIEIAAEGSDIGLCCVPEQIMNAEIIAWGERAKREVLTMREAYAISEKYGFGLEGFTGLKTGIIGSLAAVGLRAGGNDGRFLMLHNNEFRTIENSIFPIKNLAQVLGKFDLHCIEGSAKPLSEELIFVDTWFRPLLRNGLPTVFVQPAKNTEYQWTNTPKELTKQLSN